jgi:hypothetical protein
MRSITHRSRPSPGPILHRATKRIRFCDAGGGGGCDDVSATRCSCSRALLQAVSDPKARSALHKKGSNRPAHRLRTTRRARARVCVCVRACACVCVRMSACVRQGHSLVSAPAPGSSLGLPAQFWLPSTKGLPLALLFLGMLLLVVHASRSKTRAVSALQSR